MADKIVSESIPIVSAAELSDLSKEAGRPLSQEQALRFRLRRLKEHLVGAMLEACAGAK